MAIANEEELLSMMKTVFPPVRKALVIAPHPDDEVFGCGGTLSLLRDSGSAVAIVIVTDGALGGSNADGRLAEIRAEESRAAAEVLGLEAPVFWGLPDRGVNYGEALIGHLMEAVLEAGADLVFLPSPADWHPDHQAIAFAGAEAIRRLGGKRQAAFYEVSDPLPCPNLIHDISPAEEKKRQAMRCFRSQLQEQPYDTRISGINNFRALHLGAQTRSAEAFTFLAAADLDKGLPILFDGPLAYRRNSGFAASGGDIPLVSVIIRSMDRPTLTDALDSLALQTYPNIEVVLVNAKGAGHHDVGAACGRFPLCMVGTGERLPRSRAANMGLDTAQGEYLMFLDDDDWLEADHIQKLADAIRQHPEFKVVYTGVKCVDEKKNPLADKFDAPFDAMRIVAENFIPIHAVLFSRELVELGCRLDESLDVCEDWDFWLQLLRHGDFLHIDGLSAVYRITPQTGFGMNADPAASERAVLPIYRKWLNQLVDRQIMGLMHIVRHNRVKDDRISDLRQAIAEHSVLINNLNQAAAERDGRIADLNQAAAERDGRIADLNQAAAERDGRIADLNQAIAERDGRIADLNQAIAERDGQIVHIDQVANELLAFQQEVCSSTIWKLTSPLRRMGHSYRNIRSFVLRKIKPVRCFIEFLMQNPNKTFPSLKRLLKVWHDSGWVAFKRTFKDIPMEIDNDRNWLDYQRRYGSVIEAQVKEKISCMMRKPMISVLLPTYETPGRILRETLDSVIAQLYQQWELCVVDDGSTQPHVRRILEDYARRDQRIRLCWQDGNAGIAAATNRALSMARGEYIVLLDHDDRLEKQALFRVAESVLADNPDMIYSDEVLLSPDGKEAVHFLFRPAFSLELLRSHPYIIHLAAFRTSLVREIGGVDESLTISQDYDLILRIVEKSRTIVHLPEVLYAWRQQPDSAGHCKRDQVMESSAKILAVHLARSGETATVTPGKAFNFFEIRYPLQDGLRVAILIPTKNHGDLVRQCVESLERTIHNIRYDIIIIDHESTDPASLAYFAELGKRHRLLHYEGPFNFSAINNWAVNQIGSDYSHYLFCNNDIEALQEGWLDRMMELGQKPDVGIVGAALFYPDRRTYQHAGVCVGMYGIAEHFGKFMDKFLPDGGLHPGYVGSFIASHELSAVTAACLLMRKDAFDAIKGFDEAFAVGFGDVDLCLRTRRAGYRVLYCPHAELIHHESITRGKSIGVDPHPLDSALFLRRWSSFLETGDPYFNPNLSLHVTNWDTKKPLEFHLDLRRRIFVSPVQGEEKTG